MSKIVSVKYIYNLMYNIKNILTNIKDCVILMPTNYGSVK